VGVETSDDAAVYRLTDEIAMINTIDFITPPVDDPYWFGQISAANSISDIYSMGGRPVTALNVVMFPSKQLDMGLLRDILQGGNAKVIEAGASLVGGHSVDDEEPKYGLCVSGVVHPDKVITNAGSQLGDALILTKPIGTGVLFNAVRSGKMPYKEVERDVLPIVAGLNDTAMACALEFELHACTDITGFGIAGHLLEVAQGCQASVLLNYADLVLYPGVLEMYGKGETTGSNQANRTMAQSKIEIRASLSKTEEETLYDPQTSGGLLLSVPRDQARELLKTLDARGVQSAVQVGEIIDGPSKIVVV
jgi:selenide,water dikinase